MSSELSFLPYHKYSIMTKKHVIADSPCVIADTDPQSLLQWEILYQVQDDSGMYHWKLQ